MLNFKSQTQKLWPVGPGHRRRRRRSPTRMGLHMKMLSTVKKGYAPTARKGCIFTTKIASRWPSAIAARFK